MTSKKESSKAGKIASIALLGFLCNGQLQAVEPQEFFKTFCTGCHGKKEPDGDLSMVGMDKVDPKDSRIWHNILNQLASGEMPPEGEDQPTNQERDAMIRWIMDSMEEAGIQHHASGPLPTDGNRLEHSLLFGNKADVPGYSPARFWRQSQPQYDALMEKLWVIPKLRYEKDHQRDDPKWAAYSYAKPFPGLDPKHFQDYPGSVHADEAVLRALLDAGGQIAERILSDKTAYAKELQPPIAAGIPSIKRGSHWEKFQLEPPARPSEFEPFLEGSKVTEHQRHAAISRAFQIFLNRTSDEEELDRYDGLLQKSMENASPRTALKGLLTAVMVSPEFVFRMEIGRSKPDPFGRRMLSPNELVYAIAYALSDQGPDEELWEAAKSGKLSTQSDVEREVRRLLAEKSVEKLRILRFFQEFFGYPQAQEVFKDEGGWHLKVQYLVRDADMLVEHILKEDKDVFARLLTTDRYFVAFPHVPDPELLQAIIVNTVKETEEAIKKTRQRDRKIEASKDGKYSRNYALLQGRKLIPRTVHNDAGAAEYSYITIYGMDGNTFEWTDQQPIKVPGKRAGILTHPAWLVAHSTNFDNDVVRRGHWIREHLLAGRIPDVPLDMEAQVPEEPNSTLRERMRVTKEERCVRCHRRMDPLGFPFEIYDHYGHYREKEMVGTRKNQPRDIDSSGSILLSGEPGLDGDVEDAIDLVHKLAKSERVRQSIIRHAFRYWIGRNETLLDAATLQEADKRYVASDGSFKEVVVSLLTSDPFLYRK
jgi:hypothetical protein